MQRPSSRMNPLVASTLLLVACGGGASSAPPATAPASSSTSTTTAASPSSVDAELRAAVAGTQRTDKERARDAYRHPVETLEFFGLKDDMTVVEISPGGGWYSAILAPVLRDHGKLVVAGGDPTGDPKSEQTQNALELLHRFQQTPDAFGKVESVVLKKDAEWVFGPAESADMVVTFRNLHGWIAGGQTDKVLAASFRVLKHGGILGITEHRANVGASTDAKVIGKTGYVPEAYTIDLIQAAGFKLLAKSEVNANPKDTKDYPQGVWTLPPSYRLGDTDRAKYAAIGESDRMTLTFVKP